MNNFSRNKVLLAIIGILLVANFILLGFFLRAGNRPSDHDQKVGFTERLRKEVGFTSAQMQVFEPKKKAFWAKMRLRFDEIKTTKEAFYHQMYDPSIPDSIISLNAELIGKQQKELDLQVIRHFKDVRTLCTPEQLPRFDSVLPHIIRRMTDRPERK